jgi:hypothetical protein
MSVHLPDYAVLENRLRVAGAAIPPAEVHGVVCGLICSAGRAAAAAWRSEQRGLFDGNAGDVDAACTVLDELESASWEALSGEVLEFAPLLPGDAVDIGDRTAALGEFCLGFVGGLALGGWTESAAGESAGDVVEIVRDLTAISNAGVDADEDADPVAAEYSYTELTEYVRVGVQFVFETLSAGAAVPASRMLH